MSRVRVGRCHAVFPPGYSPPQWVPVLFRFATYSQVVRRFFFGLPTSRLRTWPVAQYYRLLLHQLREGDFSFLRAVAPTAELTFFSMGTYRTPAGWREALIAWRDSFTEPVFELVELLNPEASKDVVLVMRLGGRGGSSGVAVEDVAYFVLKIDKGMASRGHLYRERDAALEAVGLRE